MTHPTNESQDKVDEIFERVDSLKMFKRNSPTAYADTRRRFLSLIAEERLNEVQAIATSPIWTQTAESIKANANAYISVRMTELKSRRETL